MRLIDADKLIKRLEKWNTSDSTDKALYNFSMNRVMEQPTTYDVDKVVEQLEEKVKEYDKRIERRKGDCCFDETETIKALEERARGIEKAIEIVKGGGVNE